MTGMQEWRASALDDLPVVLALWIDSATESGWTSWDEWVPGKTGLACTSVGYLIYSDAERIVLAQSVWDGKSVDNLMHIPRVALVKIAFLRGVAPVRSIAELLV